MGRPTLTSLALILLIATSAAAQEEPSLEDLERERAELHRLLEEHDARIDAYEREHAAEEREELRDWKHELEEEFESLDEYLQEVPAELSKYFETMRDALEDLLVVVEDGIRDSKDATMEKLGEAERRFDRARNRADAEELLHDYRTHARDMDADVAAELAALEKALVDARDAEDALMQAERTLERRETNVEIAARRLELRLMEIETERLESRP